MQILFKGGIEMNVPRRILALAIFAGIVSTVTAIPRRHRPRTVKTVPARQINKATVPARKKINSRCLITSNRPATNQPVAKRMQPKPKRQIAARTKKPIRSQKTSYKSEPLNRKLVQADPIEHYKNMVTNNVQNLLSNNQMESAWNHLNSSNTLALKEPKTILQEIIANAKKRNNTKITDQFVKLSIAAPTAEDMNMTLRIMSQNPQSFGQDFYVQIAKGITPDNHNLGKLDEDIQFHILRSSLQKNDLSAVQNALEAGLNPNAHDTNWVNKSYWKSIDKPDSYLASRPIEFAIDTNNPALVSALINRGAQVDPIQDILNPHENSMLQRAIRRGKLTNNMNNSKKIISLLVEHTGWVPTAYAKNMIFITREMPTAEQLQEYQTLYETNKLETVFQVRSDLIAIAPEVIFSVK